MAVQTLLTEIITEHGAVVFNGDGYSDNWQIEAAERGLPNLKTTLDALPELIKPESLALFDKYKVFNDREMHSRYEVGLEQYALTIHVEAKLALELGSTVILPAAMRYQTEVAQNVATLKAAGMEPSTAHRRSGEFACRPEEGIGGPLGRQRHGRGVPRAEPASGDGGGPRRGRHAGRRGGRRPVAAADVPGDALHPLSSPAPAFPRERAPRERACLSLDTPSNHRRMRALAGGWVSAQSLAWLTRIGRH
jgi:hypothetical protein